MFEGMPVRGALVRLTGAWQEVLARRASHTGTGAYPAAVSDLLGEMAAAAVLMQSSIQFNGALVLQVWGDGPVKVAVAEVQPDLALRATCTLVGDVPADVPAHAALVPLLNQNGLGRCALTLDPKDRLPGQQPYQGVVALSGADGEPLTQLSQVLAQYMRQSEQLETVFVLAANAQVAAGLWVQRMPVQGAGNLAGQGAADDEARAQHDEDFGRISLLAQSLKREELLDLPAQTVLHRLFWEEPLAQFEAAPSAAVPHFACTCSRERVGRMIRSLGALEADDILAEQGHIEVVCEFCGVQQRFDPVDTAQLFAQEGQGADVASQLPSGTLH